MDGLGEGFGMMMNLALRISIMAMFMVIVLFIVGIVWMFVGSGYWIAWCLGLSPVTGWILGWIIVRMLNGC